MTESIPEIFDAPLISAVTDRSIADPHPRQKPGSLSHAEEPIDNKKRFRFLFLGLMVIFMTSGYGTYTLFGLYLQRLYAFNVRNIVNVFVVGTAAGLGFAGFAGFLFDYIGHRITIAYAALLCCLGMLLMGLMFDGHIQVTEGNSDGFFFLMNAGGYTADVVAIVVSVTHFPKNRGMVCGLYKSLSGLAPGFFSTLFRGYMKSSMPKMFYGFVGVTGVFTIITLVFYLPAAWVNFRFHRAVRVLRSQDSVSLSPDQLEEIHSRMAEYFSLKIPFLKYRIPQKRIRITFMVLMGLNIFMMTQILLIAYQNITSKAILNLFSTIAMVFVLLLSVLAWPLDCLDEKVDYSEDSVDIDEEGHAVRGGVRHSPANPLSVTPQQSVGTDASLGEFHSITREVFTGFSTRQVSEVLPPCADRELEAMGETIQKGEAVDGVVQFEIDQLTPDNHLALNYDTVTELLKYRDPKLALTSAEFWILMCLSFVVWSSGLILTNNIYMQLSYTSINKAAMSTDTYYLYSAISGIFIGSGRMLIGSMADDLMPNLRMKLGIPFSLPFTILLIVAPWMTVLGLFLILVIPGTGGFMAAYVFLSLGFGLVTSTVPYAVTCFFSFEHVGLGKMYGMCLFAVGAGVAMFYRGVFYTEYNKKAYPLDFILPQVRGVCISGKKDCAQTFLIVLLIFNVVAGILSVVLHVLYQRKIHAMAKQLIEMLQLSSSIAG